MSDQVVIAVYSFARNMVGLVTKPYETYRKIVNHGSRWELIPLAILIGSYLGIASVVKIAAFRPYILTKQFVVLGTAVMITYGLVIGLLWIFGKIVGGKGELKTIALGWAYTLVPTTIWFLATSLLYVLIPPPRTGRPLGILFSVLFLLFSSVLFFWKIILSYLTLRFGMKLDLLRIGIVFCIVIPIVAMYSIAMYQLGIFKIPFV
jgi:hypothetical protein